LYIGNEWNQKNYNNEKYIFNFVFSFCVLQLHYIYIQQINQENYYSFRVHRNMYEFGGKVMKRAIGIFLIAQALLTYLRFILRLSLEH